MDFFQLIISGAFDPIYGWVIRHSYFIIFLGMVIEGPLITTAASFAASFHIFNIWAIFGLSIMGDITGDFLWFGLGYFSRITLIRKFGYFIGISETRMEKLKRFLETHPGKTITAIKLSPLSMPGLIMTGSSHMSPKKFFSIIVKVILPMSTTFVTIGYFFGGIYNRIAVYVNNIQIAVGILVLIGVGIFFFYKKITQKISGFFTE